MFIFQIVIVLIATKLAGHLSVRLGQPSVLGKILIGIIIGPAMLGWVTDSDVMQAFSQIGVILLMFLAGLETDLEELNANEVLLDSMLFRMIQISENARHLSEEYKQIHSAIPWNALYGLRNRIVHDYGNVDLNVVYETLTNDIPELLEILSN